MRINFGALFQKKSKDKKMEGLVNIPEDSSLWPPSWKEVEYKMYDRFPQIILPKAIPKQLHQDDLVKRKSVRRFGKRVSLGNVLYKTPTLQEISNVLYYSCGETKKMSSLPTRVQASAGGRYPIEVYIINFEKGDLETKCYHYNVKDHALEEMWENGIHNRRDVQKLFGPAWTTEASFGVVLSAVVKRTIGKYGERGYRYIYLEAGEIIMNLQNNLMLEGYGSVVTGSMNDTEIEKLLDVDGEDETVIIGLVAG